MAGTPASLAGDLGGQRHSPRGVPAGTPGLGSPPHERVQGKTAGSTRSSDRQRYAPRRSDGQATAGGRVMSGSDPKGVSGGEEEPPRVLKRVDSSDFGGSRTAERAVERAVRRAQRAARTAERAQLAAARRQAGQIPLEDEQDAMGGSQENTLASSGSSTTGRRGRSAAGRGRGARGSARGRGNKLTRSQPAGRVRQAVRDTEVKGTGSTSSPTRGDGVEEVFASPPHPRTYLADAARRSQSRRDQQTPTAVRGWGTVPMPEHTTSTPQRSATFTSPPLSRLDASRTSRGSSTPDGRPDPSRPASGGTARYWRYGSAARRTNRGSRLRGGKPSEVHGSIGRAAMAAIEQARLGSNPPDGVVLLQTHDGSAARGLVQAVDAESPRAKEARRAAAMRQLGDEQDRFDEEGYQGEGDGGQAPTGGFSPSEHGMDTDQGDDNPDGDSGDSKEQAPSGSSGKQHAASSPGAASTPERDEVGQAGAPSPFEQATAEAVAEMSDKSRSIETKTSIPPAGDEEPVAAS